MTVSQIVTILECERDLYAALSDHCSQAAHHIEKVSSDLRQFELGQEFAYGSIVDSLNALLDRIAQEMPGDA